MKGVFQLLVLLTSLLPLSGYTITFEDYPATELSEARLKQIDFSSHPDGYKYQKIWQQQQRLDEIVGLGADFAGKYAIYGGGCGSQCQYSVAINVETGKVAGTIQSNWGYCFEKDSRLFIANPTLYEPIPNWAYTEYYEITDDGFKLIKKDKTSFSGECDH